MLVLDCRILPSYSGAYNSSHICFGHNNERYCGPPNVELVDSRVAQLRFVNMSLDNSGHFHCELPDLTGQWHALQSVTVASTCTADAVHLVSSHIRLSSLYFRGQTYPAGRQSTRQLGSGQLGD